MSSTQLRRKTTGAPSADPVPPGGNKTDVRQRLLQAAVELIKTQGFSALTQSGVAKLAGVRQSHLTYYFPTRSDLLTAVVEETSNTLLGMVSPQGKPTLKNIRSVIAETVGQQFTLRLYLSLIVAAEEDPSLEKWHHSFNQEHINRLTENLRQAGLQASKVEIHRFHSTLVGAYLIGLADTDAKATEITKKTVLLALKTLVSGSKRKGKSK